MVVVAEPLDERLDAESVKSEPTNEIDHIDHDPEFELILHVLGGNLSELLLRKLSPDTEGILLHNFEERGSSERLASVGILAIRISQHVHDEGEEHNLLIEAEVGPPEPLEPGLLVVELLLGTREGRRQILFRIAENSWHSKEYK